MSYLVTLEDYIPIPRYDGLPWTGARVSESATIDGVYANIDNFVFSDPDTDPSKPKIRNFTTTNATIQPAWYIVTFYDAAGNVYPTNPVRHPSIDVGPTWVPAVSEVAKLIRARTKDSFDNEVGTFTEDTRPTSLQVVELIKLMANRVALRIGTDIPDNLVDDAKLAVAVATAMAIEVSYFPEQLGTNRSNYQALKTIWDEMVGTPVQPGSLIVDVEEETDFSLLDFFPIDNTNRAFTLGMRLD